MVVTNRTGAKVSDYRPIGLQKPIVFAEVCLSTGSTIASVPVSPTLSSGTAAPTQTRPAGSVYLRTDGTVYVSQGSGTWTAIDAGIIQLQNETGAQIDKGVLVNIGTSYSSGLLEVSIADADDPDLQATHVATADIADGDPGEFASFILVSGIDTSGIAAVGDPMYLATGGTGGFTDVAPSGDTYVQRVGTMVTKNATTGSAWMYPGEHLISLWGTSNLQDDAVTTAKITDANVTAAKQAADVNAEMISFPVAGLIAINGDGANTNGGGLSGDDALLTAVPACKGLDGGVYADIATISGEAGYTANYQLLPDVPVNGDGFLLFLTVKGPEVAFDLSQLATWTGDAGKWQYSDGVGSLADLTVATLGDQTDTTANDGLRPLQQVGALTFPIPTDWVEDTLGGDTGYILQWTVTDATKVAQLPIMNSKLPEVVTPADGYAVQGARTIEVVRISDGNTTVHTAANIKFELVNYSTGASSGELTFAQDKKTDKWTLATPLACVTDNILGVVCTQEDGTNEATNAILSLETTRV